MKKYLSLLLISSFLCIHNGIAQTYLIQAKKVGAPGWVYVDINGNTILDGEYTTSMPFSECGTSLVTYPKSKILNLTDKTGKEIPVDIAGVYTLKTGFYGFGVQGFSDGILVIISNWKFGALNAKGKLVVATKFNDLMSFENGFSTGKIGKDFYIVSQDGKEIPLNDPSIIGVKKFSEGLAIYQTKRDLFGFVDTTGKVIIQAEFQGAGHFSKGLAWARNEKDLIGFINTKGKWVIEPSFSAAGNFDKVSGLAKVKTKKGWAYVDETSKILLNESSDICDDFSEGLARGKVGSKFGFLDNKLSWAITPKYEGARDFKNGYAAVKEDGLWGVIDKAGNWVIKPKFLLLNDVEKAD